MNMHRAFLIAIIARVSILGCASPLTVAETRDSGGTATPPPGQFEETGPLDSGFEGPESFLADPPDSPEDG